ncbi:MAG: 23S rRNA (uracil(1939)-C(5))-methyltransferase RlmD [Nitrospirae bacterium]|nr:MAG: 23S rRNA (uracil(1939)-C(5))-methyltransferase RlmD [Nitrospirota bacterium]
MASKPLTVTIEKLVQGGKGLARLDKQVLFVRGAIPNETVSVVVGAKQKGFQAATIGQVLEASSDRVAPPCPVYEICGGCQLQHMRYEAQLVQKHMILEETLSRVGKVHVEAIAPVVASPESYGYRSTVRFVVFRAKHGLALGFRKEGTNEPVPAADCLLVSQAMRDVAAMVSVRLAALSKLSIQPDSIEIRRSVAFGHTLLSFHTGPAKRSQGQQLFEVFRDVKDLVGQVATAGVGVRVQRWVDAQDWVADRLGDIIFRISDRSFMAANWRLHEALSNVVTEWARAAPGLRVLELYAGIGTLGLPLAKVGALVTLVEANPYALADARHAAKTNHIGRCRFRPLRAEAVLESAQAGEYDLMIVAPPGIGLSKDCLTGLLRVGAGRLLYLSSDPATLARDLAQLCGGGYRIARLRPFDMLPQTAHVETLVELVR